MIGYTILEFQSISSTNTYLKENYNDLSNFTIVKTEYQTAGKGQFDRTWEAEPGKNLLFSILFKQVPLHNMKNLQDWIVISLSKFFKDLQIETYFKMPNDFYVNQNKICGILTETKIQKNTYEYIVIGIGINVNQTMFQSPQATSLKNELKQGKNIANLFNHLLDIFYYEYQRIF